MLNLGILAHVDAGKTSLTERLLYTAGVIDEVGSVDDGSTQTDSLELERQRGLTIKSAVVSFVIGDIAVNLIDTPGHPDFIAEVERVLNVLDGAVLVISAVEGVQAQTRVLKRTLQRLRIPTLIFVNKIDRAGAQYERVLRTISKKLTAAIIPMGSGSGLGTRGAVATPYAAADADFTSRLVELLADHDDALLAAYVEDETTVSYRQLRCQLPAQEKIAYVRMFSGTLRTRDRLQFRRGNEGKVTAIGVFDRGSAVQRASVAAGQIGKLWGLGDIQIGDTIGASQAASQDHYFAPPTLETVVVPCRAADKGALHVALTQLAEQDPLINLRQDDIRQEIFVSLYGEVQKEVIQATLANEFDIDVTFRETTTICIERPAGTGAAVERIGKAGNPFLATVGLRIEPAPINSGLEFRLEVELGAMPFSFFKAVEDTVREALHQGIHGWQVTDCMVTMTHSGYCPRQSHSHAMFDKSMSSTGWDFRKVTPLVLMSALKQAGTSVYEPMHRFHLEIPADTFGPILPVLGRLRAVPRRPAMRGSSCTLEGEIPAAQVHELEQQLLALTRGEGVLECAFDHYQPVSGTIPSRPRSDHNPLNRKEYLLHVMRRV